MYECWLLPAKGIKWTGNNLDKPRVFSWLKIWSWRWSCFLHTSPQATFQVMRKYLDTESVVQEKILLHPLSPGGRLTDGESEEQQANEAVSSRIDCQLTSEVHYTDRPEPQHNDLHTTNALITTYESLSETNLSLHHILALSFFFSTVHLEWKPGLNKPDWRISKATFYSRQCAALQSNVIEMCLS